MQRNQQPVNQKRLTNIVIIKLKKGGMRFEVAAYPNKVEEYRKKMYPDTCEFLTFPPYLPPIFSSFNRLF